MTDLSARRPAAPRRAAGWLTRLAGSRRFHDWAVRIPFLRGKVRREGEEMFDLVAGFCQSQILLALVATGVLERLRRGPADAAALAAAASVPTERMQVLLRGGVALGLLRAGSPLRLTPRGAALLAVPGLAEMIRHHDVLYRDLSDPVAFFRGEVETELADLWPYVFGAGAAQDPDRAARYSRLMQDSMGLVAQDTLAVIDLHGVRRLMDVGGGTGAFLRAVAAACPGLDLTLFDLPAVTAAAQGLPARVTVRPGSFRDDPLPGGADAISLVRVLYDHDDATVAALLRKVHSALPPRGRVIVSEPMTGCRAGDTYFALYCMAMRTGRARGADEIGELLRSAGFCGLRAPAPRRAYVTSVIEAVRKS
ncbi:MAG: demethylspheroidene O-methyltransferase [Rhodobacteraceae bacterium HLUCCA08]|nr:MAG: demethylspheroidene O-methyltransferase [Rhodobacteraceae bacterium HLUCCA08]